MLTPWRKYYRSENNSSSNAYIKNLNYYSHILLQHLRALFPYSVTMITITIDWGAWTGKWTTALWVAKQLGYKYIDTWAMYRWVALEVLEKSLDPNSERQIVACASNLKFSYEYTSVTDTFDLLINWINKEKQIRDPKVASIVHIIAQYPQVRELLVSQQQSLWNKWWVVFDGRDCGTVIAPNAKLKIHLICDLEVRAKRRQEQYLSQWKQIDIESIKKDLYERDQKDLYGPDATNFIAPDAIELDTTYLSIDQQIAEIVRLSRRI